MPIISLYNDAITLSLPAGIRKRRRAAIFLSYLTWPNNPVARNGFILEPLGPAIRPASGVGYQIEPIAAHLKLAADKIQVVIDRNRDADQANHLRHASLALQNARDLMASSKPPVSDWEAAAEAANYFAGFDPGGQPHSLLRRQGRGSLLEELNGRCAGWHLAGLRLFLCAQMHIHHLSDAGGEASLRKARNVIEDRTKFNRKQIDVAWKSYKTVSPLAAGVIQTLRRRPKFHSIKTIPSRDDFRSVIDGLTDEVATHAAAFQAFILSFQTGRPKSLLLPANKVWMLPVASTSTLDSILKPLYSDDLEALIRAGRDRS